MSQHNLTLSKSAKSAISFHNFAMISEFALYLASSQDPLPSMTVFLTAKHSKSFLSRLKNEMKLNCSKTMKRSKDLNENLGTMLIDKRVSSTIKRKKRIYLPLLSMSYMNLTMNLTRFSHP